MLAKHIKAKLLSFVALFLLTFFSGDLLAGTLFLRTEVDDYVSGVHNNVVLKLYIKTNDENLGIYNFLTSLYLSDPVILDEEQQSSYLASENLAEFDECLAAGEIIQVAMTGNPTVPPHYVIPGSTEYIHIATVEFKLQPNWEGPFEFFIDTETMGLGLWNIAGEHGDNNTNYQFEGFELNTPATVEINVLKGFNFKTITDFEVEEDAHSGDNEALEIAATSSNFTCQVWDGEKLATPSVAPAIFTENIEVSVDEGDVEDIGNLWVENGKIYYKQKKDYYGEFTVHYEVQATSASPAQGSDSGSFKIVVTPVNDAPEISLLDYYAVEGEQLVFSISVTDVEDDSFVVNNVKLGENEIAGSWAPVDDGMAVTRTDANTPGEYTFTSTAPLSYDLVQHPAKKADLVLTVLITDTNAAPEQSELSETITIDDSDRPQSPPTFTGFNLETPKTTDDVYGNFTVVAKDEDGDEVAAYPTWTWSEGGIPNVMQGNLLPSAITKKGIEYTFNVYSATNPYGEGLVESAPVGGSVTVINSAPVAQDHKVFIRKMDGGDGIKVFDLFAADVDGDVLAFSIDGAGPQKGSLDIDIEGNTATYEVNNLDAEFFGDNADVFSILVDDGDGGTTTFQVSVTYRENPPASISTTKAPDAVYFEVDENGNATTITVAIRAEDSTEVLPAGIPQDGIKWEVLRDGVALATGWEQEVSNSFDPIQVDELRNGNLPGATSECTFTLGYDILQGADRPAEADFVIRVTVTDALGSEETEEWPIIVKDVDRQPSAPTKVDFDADVVKVNDILTALAEGAEDEDGDVISSYYYVWNNGQDEVVGDTLSQQVKGETWTVKAYAVTEPYGAAEVKGEQYAENEIFVSNTAPEAEDIETETDEDSPLTITLLGSDADEADELLYEIGTEPANGSLALDGDQVTYTPDQDYAGEDWFTYYVYDGEDKVEARVTIVIHAIDDAPVLDNIPSNIYIVPDNMGEELTFTYTIGMGGGADEVNQEIADVTLGEIVGDAIFAVLPTASGERQIITLIFTVKADAALGSEAEFEITVVDSGRGEDPHQNSATKTIKVVLGATPWYPIYAIACNEHAIHQVSIIDQAGDTVAELIVEGDTMKPADYYEAGVEGLPAGEEYKIELRAWSASAGVNKQPCDVDAPDLQVPSYTVPGKGELSYDLDAKQFKISTPLAASYTLSISYPNDSERVFKGVYTPNEDGLILPEVVLPMEFFAAGDYHATVFGTNPKGDGELSELINFSIAADSTATLEWPADGFVPADSASILVAEGVSSSKVNFSWPVLSAASSYRVLVTDASGKEVASTSGLSENSWNAQLPVAKDSNSFAWFVEAKDDSGKTAKSFTWSFSIIKKTSAPLLSKVVAIDGGLKLSFAAFPGAELENILYEVQLFSVTQNQWYNFMLPNQALGFAQEEVSRTGDDSVSEGLLDLGDIEVETGDFVMLRPFYKGKQAGSFVLYSIQ